MNQGERIKLIRNIFKLNQTEMGKILAISQNAIGKIENNKNSLTNDNLIKLCEYFNISADFILFGTDESETIVKLMNNKERK